MKHVKVWDPTPPPEEELATFRTLLDSILPVPRAEDPRDLTAIWLD